MKAARESDPARRAAWLRAEIQRHERLYYALGKPEISDREFDRLMAELVALEAASPKLATADSPTRRVGGEPLSGFVPVRHEPPMMSLDNTYNLAELREWAARLERLAPAEAAAAKIMARNSRRALTRGKPPLPAAPYRCGRPRPRGPILRSI